jgi:hypothetical protein
MRFVDGSLLVAVIATVTTVSTVVVGAAWRLSESIATHHERVTASVERVSDEVNAVSDRVTTECTDIREDLRHHTVEEERITKDIYGKMSSLSQQSGETSRRVAHLLTISGVNPRDVP